MSGRMAKFRIVWMGPDEDPRQYPTDANAADSPQTSRWCYERVSSEMVLRERLQNGRMRITPLTNFTARILRDVVYDEEAEAHREFILEVELAGERVRLVVSAAEFAGMRWVLCRVGPQAIIYPGQQQHARAAIQYLSRRVPQEHVFTSLGWVKHRNRWVYLQSQNAIPAEAVADLHARLPRALNHYQTHAPAGAEDRIRAVRASLSFLSVAGDRISVRLLAAIYRAPFGDTDFSLFLTGRTGTFKSALAALCQQHFGAHMDARRLPANFASTANALEELAFHAKDSLRVVDDFVPSGRRDGALLDRIAERLFRGAGNGQGRSRMRGAQVHAERSPRALLVATGEEVPRGHSIRARLLIIEIRPHDVNVRELTKCQSAAADAQFAAGMAAYLVWIARQYEPLKSHLSERAGELRAGAPAGKVHARLPDMMAQLQSAWEMWLEFALDVGAITESEQRALLLRGRKALQEVAGLQAAYHQASDPTRRFLSLLKAALANGRAHVADRKGVAPDSPAPWGWRKKGGAWFAEGTRIGWLSGSDVFLEPSASYHVAQQMAGSEPIPISPQTLRHRMAEQGLLVSTDAARKVLMVRRILESCPRTVLHVRRTDLLDPQAGNQV
jgi:hypothetical protein